MKWNLRVYVIVVLLLTIQIGCSHSSDQVIEWNSESKLIACDSKTHHKIESKVGTSDGQGHGPDVGSDEWKSVVEFKLGVRGLKDIPVRNSIAWCEFVIDLMNHQ